MASVLLLTSGQEQLDYTGTPVRADGWYGYPDGLHTVAIYVQNFVGRVYIEGSLSIQPTEEDWFAIRLTPDAEYVQYPLNPNNPSSGFVGGASVSGDTSVLGFTFKANILWIRARVHRTYIFVPTLSPDRIGILGNVKKIVLSL